MSANNAELQGLHLHSACLRVQGLGYVSQGLGQVTSFPAPPEREGSQSKERERSPGGAYGGLIGVPEDTATNATMELPARRFVTCVSSSGNFKH